MIANHPDIHIFRTKMSGIAQELSGSILWTTVAYSLVNRRRYNEAKKKNEAAYHLKHGPGS